MAFSPKNINDRIKKQLKDARGNDAANHRGGDAFHDIRAALATRRPHNGKQSEKNGTNSHDFGPDALDRAFDDSGLEVVHGIHAPRSAEFVPGVIEVQQHDDAGFGVEAGESNEANPDGDTHVIAEEVEKPERADQREGDGEKNDGCFNG